MVRPIISKDFNERGQVDLVDFQSLPEKQFKWILNYQDHSTKFLFLRPMETKRAEEVASNLLSIFLLIGAPKILQSDNGREFVNKVVIELKNLWPECIIVHGRPRHPESQGSIERSNQDVENMIRAWMSDNNSKRWSVGLQFVQWQKNISYHRTIGRSPYKALLGCDPKIGLTSSSIPSTLARALTIEEELMEIFDEEENVDLGEVNDCIEDENLVPEEVHVVMTEENADTTITDNNNINYKINEDNLSANKSISNAQEIRCKKCLCIFHPSEDSEQAASVFCSLCDMEANILTERQKTRQRTEENAKKMLSTSSRKIATLNQGDCVLLSVPKVDRGPGDSRNIVCLIINQKNGVNQVASKHGTIKGWFGPESLSVAGCNFLRNEDIPVEKCISLREAVCLESGGQGMSKCACKPSSQQCTKNRCACKKSNVLCNSRCHNSLPCFNK